jgi:hypothetical protein
MDYDTVTQWNAYLLKITTLEENLVTWKDIYVILPSDKEQLSKQLTFHVYAYIFTYIFICIDMQIHTQKSLRMLIVLVWSGGLMGNFMDKFYILLSDCLFI